MSFRAAFPFRRSPQPDEATVPVAPVTATTAWGWLYMFLRPLTVIVGLLAFANFVILATALHVPDTMYPTSFSFMDFQQLVVNGVIVFACLYSFGRATWSSNYRLTMIWIICVLSLIYSISLLVKIQSHGGCTADYFSDVSTRCIMQYVISGIELLWTALLLADGFISYRQSRDVEWFDKVRAQEEAQVQASAVHYQPDLSLYGNGATNSNEIGNHDIENAGPNAVELETLPAYMPRPDKDQPRIVDLANVRAQQAPTYYAPPTTPPPTNLAYSSSSSIAEPSTQQPTAEASSPASEPSASGLIPPAASLPSYAP